jgi:hypothetical protein
VKLKLQGVKVSHIKKQRERTELAAIEITRQTKDIIKSFRLSRELLDLINQECRYRNLDFSAYIRHAATLALKHRSDIGHGNGCA